MTTWPSPCVRPTASSHPTSSCTTLTAPASFAVGTLVFTDPASTTLAANTTYSLLITSPGGENVLLAATSSDDEDSGGATGWTIANAFHVEGCLERMDSSRTRALRITIKGTTVGTVTTSSDATLSALALDGCL